jgi:hypothetical protein
MENFEYGLTRVKAHADEADGFVIVPHATTRTAPKLQSSPPRPSLPPSWTHTGTAPLIEGNENDHLQLVPAAMPCKLPVRAKEVPNVPVDVIHNNHGSSTSVTNAAKIAFLEDIIGFKYDELKNKLVSVDRKSDEEGATITINIEDKGEE